MYAAKFTLFVICAAQFGPLRLSKRICMTDESSHFVVCVHEVGPLTIAC
jgi:hypothetical protein